MAPLRIGLLVMAIMCFVLAFLAWQTDDSPPMPPPSVTTTR